ncbi:hypothetical protein LEP1GSC071_2277 [Leptospira santarosai str. JET]|nr:hypothetical protein LEP1GSC071_2277 [Leptospira santarosai str. JET]
MTIEARSSYFWDNYYFFVLASRNLRSVHNFYDNSIFGRIHVKSRKNHRNAFGIFKLFIGSF